MKIRYTSDLHLEFLTTLFSKQGDDVRNKMFYDFAEEIIPYHDDDRQTVLILAGDICEGWRAHTRYYGFFRNLSLRFDKVVWIPGNHEYYGNKFSKHYDKKITKNMYENFGNVYFLNNGCLGIDELNIICSTLWTNVNNHDPLIELKMGYMMNDYHKITFHDEKMDLYRTLRVYDTIKKNLESIDYLKDKLSKTLHQPTIVVTHHAPFFESVPEKYKFKDMSHAYANSYTERDFELMPDFWIHGHIHDSVDYMVSKTRVLSNPRGYPQTEENDGYNPNAFFEIS